MHACRRVSGIVLSVLRVMCVSVRCIYIYVSILCLTVFAFAVYVFDMVCCVSMFVC